MTATGSPEQRGMVQAFSQDTLLPPLQPCRPQPSLGSPCWRHACTVDSSPLSSPWDPAVPLVGILWCTEPGAGRWRNFCKEGSWALAQRGRVKGHITSLSLPLPSHRACGAMWG